MHWIFIFILIYISFYYNKKLLFITMDPFPRLCKVENADTEIATSLRCLLNPLLPEIYCKYIHYHSYCIMVTLNVYLMSGEREGAGEGDRIA